jgi:GTP diphosphokinase / guanosine-3',5'-bis(diphosphate) 3'-diphosphatase
MNRLDDLLTKIRRYNPDTDTGLITAAYNLAARLHSQQTRNSGQNLLDHLVSVADMIADIELDDQAIITALLHESIRKGGLTEADISREFGSTITEYLVALTQLSVSPFVVRDPKFTENVKKVFLLFAKDIRVALVRLADRVDNVKTISALPPQDQAWAARQAISFYAPIAEILGVHYYQRQLEDGGFAILHPKAFADIRHQLQLNQQEMEQAIEGIKQRLLIELSNQKITPQKIYGRAKNIYSIWKKLLRYQKQGRVEDLLTKKIYDQMALMIIVDKVPECYQTLGIINKMFDTVTAEFDDYIAKPKPNGYSSIHSVIEEAGHYFEIQIRTEDMNRENEFGQAAHFHYKAKGVTSASSKETHWVQHLSDWSSANIKEIFSEKVFIFSPKGDVYELPVGSTPVDFAFAVHGDLGSQCIGAKVDSKITPLSLPLKSGQTVEILVNKNKTKPSPDWIRFVVTEKAKDKLKKAKL